MWGPKRIGPTHTPIPPSLIYSNASCSTLIPWNDVTLPHVHVDFTMYPNATGAPTDAELGTRARFTFDFDISVQCPPVHEGGTSHLTIIWNNMTSLRVDRDDDGTTVISCAALGACGDDLPVGYSRTVVTRTDGRTQLTLLTHYATRHGSKNAAINWVISVPNTPKQVRAECKIFEKTLSAYCNNTLSTSGVNITCSAEKIFPEGRCLIKSTKETERAVLPESIHYHHLELPKSSLYYDTTCSALVPWALIDPQRPKVSVIIYPNVTGRDSDSTYGSYLFIQIHAEGPSVVLEQCPLKVERGLNASCTCVSTSNNASVFWNSSEPGHGVSVLTFDADTLKVFQCQGRSSEGFLGVANTYKPHISYPPVVGGPNGHADKSSSNDDLLVNDLHIKCEVENNTSVSVRLEKHDEPISWLHEDNAGLWERNKRKCEESQYYECVVTGDDWTTNENFVTSVECLKHYTILDSSTSSSGGVAAAVICIIIVIGLVVAGVFIVYKVKPPFVVRFLRPTTGADSQFVDVTEDTYQPRGMTYTTSKCSPFQHDVDDNTYQPPPPVDAMIKAKEAIKPKPSHDYDSPSSIPVAYEHVCKEKGVLLMDACGHVCKEKCVLLTDACGHVCKEKCVLLMDACGHVCKEKFILLKDACWQVCKEKRVLLMDACGHVCKEKCVLLMDDCGHVCKEKCVLLMDACGHVCKEKCVLLMDACGHVCKEKCVLLMDACGHVCKEKFILLMDACGHVCKEKFILLMDACGQVCKEKCVLLMDACGQVCKEKFILLMDACGQVCKEKFILLMDACGQVCKEICIMLMDVCRHVCKEKCTLLMDACWHVCKEKLHC
ncbi:hypothetical protein Btru_071834 [Bulinus truncatus]|nr:hypothetical protein Btru_071834 [Bulinus truncatus]